MCVFLRKRAGHQARRSEWQSLDLNVSGASKTRDMACLYCETRYGVRISLPPNSWGGERGEALVFLENLPSAVIRSQRFFLPRCPCRLKHGCFKKKTCRSRSGSEIPCKPTLPYDRLPTIGRRRLLWTVSCGGCPNARACPGEGPGCFGRALRGTP